MSSLTEYAENYVNNALKQQSSSDKNEKKQLQKQMDKSRKNYIDKYISGRQLPFKKKGIMGYDRQSKATLKKAEQAFDRHFQAIVTLRNEETERKNKERREELEKRKAEEKARQERTNNECTKIKTKEECVSPQNINNCYWNVKAKNNEYGDTLWDNTCQKITKRSIKIGKRTRKRRGKPSSLDTISEEGDVDSETEELSTLALTPKQRNELVQQSLNIGPGISSHMSAGKRKRPQKGGKIPIKHVEGIKEEQEDPATHIPDDANVPFQLENVLIEEGFPFVNLERFRRRNTNPEWEWITGDSDVESDIEEEEEEDIYGGGKKTKRKRNRKRKRKTRKRKRRPTKKKRRRKKRKTKKRRKSKRRR